MFARSRFVPFPDEEKIRLRPRRNMACGRKGESRVQEDIGFQRPRSEIGPGREMARRLIDAEAFHERRRQNSRGVNRFMETAAVDGLATLQCVERGLERQSLWAFEHFSEPRQFRLPVSAKT